MSKHLVRWGKAERKGERGYVYNSKDGKFVIEKRYYASFGGRNGSFNQVGYRLTIVATGKSEVYDSLEEAKLNADWEIDPNWDTEA